MVGAEMWHRILNAIDRLQARNPAAGEQVHEKARELTPDISVRSFAARHCRNVAQPWWSSAPPRRCRIQA